MRRKRDEPAWDFDGSYQPDGKGVVFTLSIQRPSRVDQIDFLIVMIVLAIAEIHYRALNESESVDDEREK